MVINLTNTQSRLLFFSIVLFVVGILALGAGKAWLAAYWDSAPNPEAWMKAAVLEPDNASYWEHAGLYERWDLTSGNPRHAFLYLERATELNPRSDRFWIELANEYEMLADLTRAKQSYERAQQAHPISPQVAWTYASFLLREGDCHSGFAEIRRALAGDPSLTTNAIVECWKTCPNIEDIVSAALPATSDYYITVINFLIAEKQLDASLVVWNRLLTLKQPIKMSQATVLTNALLDRNRVTEAQQTWQQSLHITNWPQEHNDNGSIVFNGGFEYQTADGGFDWRQLNLPGVSYAFDTDVFHSGKQSLRVTFHGNANIDYAHLIEYVPVERNQRYHFSAYLRTESITTDSGLRFLIYNPVQPSKVQVITPNMTGTNAWTNVNADVTTSDTNVIVIALRRIPSWKFDNKLSGTAWVDDVRFQPWQSAPKEPQQ